MSRPASTNRARSSGITPAAARPIARRWKRLRGFMAIENKYEDRKQGMQAGIETVLKLLGDKGITYDELVFSL